MAVLKKNQKAAKKHQLAASAPFDTLDSIAKKNKVEGGWEGLALYLFGSKEADEVNRGISETIGAAKVDLIQAEKTQLKAMAGHPGEIALPEDWTDNTFKNATRYRLSVRRVRAPSAVAITSLDKWFIPGKESNDIRFTVEGDPESANLLDFSVYGSNYCECTDWNNGLGKYKILEDEPIFAEEGIKVPERCKSEVLNVTGAEGKNAWKGGANTQKGILSVKGKDEKERFANVAFSPYTVHFRYRKLAADKKARLALEPFWPQFEDTKAEPAVTPDFSASPATFSWTNAEDQDYGVLEVFDAEKQRVHMEVLKAEALAKGAKSTTWDKKYTKGVLNGKFEDKYLDDSAEVDPLKRMLFKSTPYVAKLTTFKAKPKADSLKIKYEVKDTEKLERGLLIVTATRKDPSGAGVDEVVFQKVLKKGDLAKKKHEFTWDGKYLPAVKNSRAKKDDPANKVYEVIPEDMPYRVQIQAHTDESATEGLALAAMHTEVRLHVHKADFQPADPRYDPAAAKPSLALARGSFVPGDPPKEEKQKEWFRHKLAEFGFHPGPVTEAAESDVLFKIALKEYKRSVPANPGAASPNFTRLNLDAGNDITLNDETKTSLKAIADGNAVTYTRKAFGDPEKVLNNSNEPDLDGEQLDKVLADPEKDLILWVDDRQYYTESDNAKDENNRSFTSGNAAAVSFGLQDYRGGMVNADGRADTDEKNIARPWIPLQADLRLLSRKEPLDVEYREDKLRLADAKLQQAMQKAIGPLRVDWTFEELPFDVSTIDPASVTNYDKELIRSRMYTAWAIFENKEKKNRADTKRDAFYFNCKKLHGGSRPDSLAGSTYYKDLFGTDKLSLAPWKASGVSTTESVSTVVHDHLSSGQVAKTDLFDKVRGQAGVYFNPSRIAGDGYRLRAEVKFEKFTGYEFPNLDVLKSRYAAAPTAHSARMRVWRRSSFRGFMSWGRDSGNWGDPFINAFREQYRCAHVYFIHEGAKAHRSFDINEVYNPGNAAAQSRYKKIIKNNVSLADLKDEAKMTLKGEFVWPWSDRADFGWKKPSPVNLAAGKVYNDWLNGEICNETWRKFRYGLLMACTKEVEKSGIMRGHLLVEFEASSAFFAEEYRCNHAAPHKYWYLEKGTGAGARMNGQPCPAPGCGSSGKVLTSTNQKQNYTSMPLPAVGGALGATWLFWEGSDPNRLKVVWVHEVGHHRHLEHSANAPGAKSDLHDSQANMRVTNWKDRRPPPNDGNWGAGFEPIDRDLALQDSRIAGTANAAAWADWAVTPEATILNTPGMTQANYDFAMSLKAAASARRWDRGCIMSYSDAWYGELGCFCGRCLLRNRGWKVTQLGFPANRETSDA